MDKEENEYAQVFKEDEYVAIKWSEYKELLITKGRYEELKRQEDRPSIQYIPNIQPLAYPNDNTLTKITCDRNEIHGRNSNGVLS